jgi:hypothetical protein
VVNAPLGGDVRIVHNASMVGSIRATHQAAALARGKYLVLLKSDTAPQAGWLEALVALAESDALVGAVGCRLCYADGRLCEAGALVFSDGTRRGIGHGDDPFHKAYGNAREVDACAIACLLVRRDVWEQVAGLDDRYAPGSCEDVDLCLAVRKLGHKVMYCPGAFVVTYEDAQLEPDAESLSALRAKWQDELCRQPDPEGAGALGDGRLGAGALGDGRLGAGALGDGRLGAGRAAGQAYRVCVIAPPGYVHSACFSEVAEGLVASLRDLGHDCDITLNQLAPDRTNVLLGFHMLTYTDALCACRYIPYQLEQLSEKDGYYSENVQRLLEHATSVWDYSDENIAFLAARGIAARRLPIGYHPALERIPTGGERHHDVLFYGSPNERRTAVLDRIAAADGVRLKSVFGAYGRERDRLIAAAGMVLNVHYFSAKILEAVRISYLLNNRCFVLSETSAVHPYPGVDLCCAPYDELADRCLYYVQHDAERETLRMAAYEQFKRLYPMKDMIAKVLS